MPNLNVTECKGIAGDSSGISFAAPEAPFNTVQDVSFNSTEQQSVAFADGTRFIRIRPDADCVYAVGENPVIGINPATFLGAGQIEFIGVKRGMKIAVKAP